MAFLARRRGWWTLALWGPAWPLLALWSVGTAMPPAHAAEAGGGAKPPNVIVILSDDLGYGTPNCYGSDPALVQTPQLDRLAREGRRFTDANTPSSVCSPTRYALLTGRYCWRTSLKHEVLGSYSPLHIEPGRLNLASLLKSRGYATAAVGKWHLGYGSAPRADFTAELRPGPLEIGFDYHFGVPSNHGDVTGVYVEDRGVLGLRSARLNPGGQNFNGNKFLGLDAPQRVDPEVMDVLTDKAVAWLERQADDRPFFLYFTPVAVHNPITPSQATAGSSRAGPYGDFLHDLDRSVGRVLEVLDRRGWADETIVLFTSDNGGSGEMAELDRPQPAGKGGAAAGATPQLTAIRAGLDFNRPWRGRKHSVYEGGFRVPYLVRWPGHVPAGTTCDEMLGLVDTLATVAAIVGVPLPPAQEAAEDSYNVLPAWLGQSDAGPLRPDLIVHSAAGTFAIRDGRWKYIEGGHHPDTKPGALRLRAAEFRPQLYDLRADPAESTDVAAKYPQEVERLQALLDGYRQAHHSRP